MTDMSVSPVPDRSTAQDRSNENLKPVPDRCRTAQDRVSGEKPEPVPDRRDTVGVTARTGPDRPSRTTPLHDWISTLKPRGITLTIEDGQPILTGPTTGHDHRTAQTYRHALTIAAARGHEAWWNHLLNRAIAPIGPDDIPWTCATCGTDHIHILDNNLICWCDQHLEHANTDGWPTWENS